jgi:hypothetical protein
VLRAESNRAFTTAFPKFRDVKKIAASREQFFAEKYKKLMRLHICFGRKSVTD